MVLHFRLVLLIWTLAILLPHTAQGQYHWSTVAGQSGGVGFVDGTVSSSQFNQPQGLARDTAGNLYVADTANSAIRKITPAGIVSTLAGSPVQTGSTDGAGTAARFNRPVGIAVDKSGNVYVADTQNHSIRKITPAGAVSTLAGKSGTAGNLDGTGAAARFNAPTGIAVDKNGAIYVSDSNNFKVRKITPTGAVSSLPFTASHVPAGLAVDASLNVFAVDLTGLTLVQITPQNVLTPLAALNGVTLTGPSGLTIDSAGTLYFTDAGGNDVLMVKSGQCQLLAGSALPGNIDAQGTAAAFNNPRGIAADDTGTVYVADTNNSLLRQIAPDTTVTRLAGHPANPGTADGPGSTALFSAPGGVAVDNVGNVYVADTANNILRLIAPDHTVSTVAGEVQSQPGWQDGSALEAIFSHPRGLAIDASGIVYIADTNNHAVRRLLLDGTVDTYVGRGVPGALDGAASVALLTSPTAVAVSKTGILYIADSSFTLRAVSATGVVSTRAGTAGVSGTADGTGPAARFAGLQGLAVDASGNIYVADLTSLRKVSPAGVVTTLAKGNAAIKNPSGIQVDPSGNLLVTDSGNQTIYQVTPAGAVTVLGGLANIPGGADGTGTAARFSQPGAIARTPSGVLYVADTLNNRISQGLKTTAPFLVDGANTLTSDTAVQLSCWINPLGLATTVKLTYGLTTTYGITVPVTLPSGSSSVVSQLSVPLANLAPNTTYHYQFTATTSGGAFTSGDATFTTPASGGLQVTFDPTFAGDNGAQWNLDGGPWQSNGATLGNIHLGDHTVNFKAIPGFTTPDSQTITVTSGVVQPVSAFYVASETGSLQIILQPDAVNAANAQWLLDGGNPTFTGQVLSGVWAGQHQISFIPVDGWLILPPQTILVSPSQTATATVTYSQMLWQNFAGLPGVQGATDGTAGAANFDGPQGVAVDAAGNIYVADTNNNAIRKITPSGSVSTLAGFAPGNVNGTGPKASFLTPISLAVDKLGNVFVGDSGNHSIRKVTPAGVVTTFATGSYTTFTQPSKLAFAPNGNLYVLDTTTEQMWSYTPAGVAKQVTGTFDEATAMTLDTAGNLYVIFSYGSLELIPADGSSPSIISNSSYLSNATGLTCDAQHRLFFTASTSMIGEVTLDGSAVLVGGTYYTQGSTDGLGQAGLFATPMGIAASPSGQLYVADQQNDRISIGLPPGAPAPATSSLANITGSSASLSGAVSTGGLASTVVVEYGATTAYGHTTTLSLPGSSTSPQAIAANLTGLTPGATYHYAIVVTNANGSVTTTDATFTTNPLVGSLKVTLSATVTSFGSPQWSVDGGPWQNSGVTLPNLSVGAHRVIYQSLTGLTAPAPQTVTISANATTSITAAYTGFQEYGWTNYAGIAGGPGSSDGPSAQARFNGPCQIARDASGNVYVADQTNCAIRKITPAGAVTTLAGGAWGVRDGLSGSAQFAYPRGVAVDPAGNVYVADTNNHSIRKITPAGLVTTLAGLSGTPGTQDGTGPAARFNFPSSLALDKNGLLYVADTSNCTIRTITPSGVVTTLAGNPGYYGNVDGVGAGATFQYPMGIAIDPFGKIYVADTVNNRIRIVAPDGTVTPFAGSGTAGTADGLGAAASFYDPTSIAFELDGTLYVTDTGSNTLRKITPYGAVTTLVGAPGFWGATDGAGAAAHFNGPIGLTTDGVQNLYVSELSNNDIRKVTFQGVVTTFAGKASTPGSANGALATATFSAPGSVVADSAGNVYVMDGGNSLIRKITPAGTVSTLAGGGATIAVDGAGAAAGFGSLFGFALDPTTGNLMVIDGTLLRKVSPTGLVSTTTLSLPFSVVSLTPNGIAVDPKGTTYLAGGGFIFKVNPAGVPVPFVGQPLTGTAADGTGATAAFASLGPIASDSAGNLIAGDGTTLRKITPAGVVTTLTTSIPLELIRGIAVDAAGNIFTTSNTPENLVYEIKPDGTVYIIGGSSVSGSVDGIGNMAEFSGPLGLCVTPAGIIYMADAQNNRITKGTLFTGLPYAATGGTDNLTAQSVTLYGVLGASGYATTARFIYGTTLDYGSSDIIPPAPPYSASGLGVNYLTGHLSGLQSNTTYHYRLVATNAKGMTEGDDATFTTPPLFDSALVVKISPPEAVTAGAQWSVDGGALQNSGVAVSYLAGGAHLVTFTTLDGYSPQPVQSVNTQDRQTSTIFVTYSKVASSLQVVLSPPEAIAAGAQWIVDGGSPHNSGDVVPNLSPGPHSLTFTPAAGFVPPLNQSLPLADHQNPVVNASYVPLSQTGSLQVTLSPPAAVTGGAQWRVDGGAWLASGASSPPLGQGPHTVSFTAVNGYAIPSSQTVTIGAGQSSTASATYQQFRWSTVAGPQNPGPYEDAVGAAARFNGPSAVIRDAQGNLYVSDKGNQLIRKITADGTVTTVAGVPLTAGSLGGSASLSRFNNPNGLALDSQGNLWVADTSNYVLRKITPDGQVSTPVGLTGSAGTSDGLGSVARFLAPVRLAIDAQDKIYVLDGQHIRTVTPDGQVSTLGVTLPFVFNGMMVLDPNGKLVLCSNGYAYRLDPTLATPTLVLIAGGPPASMAPGAGTFGLLKGVAIDTDGTLYLNDTGTATVVKITSTGVVSTLAGTPGTTGYVDGPVASALFSTLGDMILDHQGHLLITDANSIRQIDLNAGIVSTVAGQTSNATYSGIINATGPLARFNSPNGLTVDNFGNAWVVDSLNDAIREVTPAGVVTTFVNQGLSDMPIFIISYPIGIAIPINPYPIQQQTTYHPVAIARDATSGNFYVTTSQGTLRQVTPQGVVSILPNLANGQNVPTGFFPILPGNGLILVPPTTISLNPGTGGTLTLTGTPPVQTSGGTLTLSGATLSMAGTSGLSFSGGYAQSGNYNSALTRNTVIIATGISNPTFGTISSPPNVTPPTPAATTASDPVEGATLTINDTAASTLVIQSSSASFATIAPSGTLAAGTTLTLTAGNVGTSTTTIADAIANNGVLTVTSTNVTTGAVSLGTIPASSASLLLRASNQVATLATASINLILTLPVNISYAALMPYGVAVDSHGVVYTVSKQQNSITKYDPATALTSLLAGSATAGFADGPGAAASFYRPCGLAVDSQGNVFVADNGNQAIRKITPSGQVTTVVSGHPLLPSPTWIAVDPSGNLFVTNGSSGTSIQVANTVCQVSPDGQVALLGGLPNVIGSDDGIATAARFGLVAGISTSPSGALYVTDALNDRVSEGLPANWPDSDTGLASQIAATTATISGTVDPQGVSTTVTVQYGLTDQYGQSMDVTLSPADGLTPQAISAALANLLANSTYHYRIVATNANGTVYGGDATFTTLPRTGSVQVNLSPSAAVTEGAAWRVDGGAWQTSGAIASGVPVGPHVITFMPLTPADFAMPSPQAVTVAEGQTTVTSATYGLNVQYLWSNFTGTPGQVGSTNATGAAARFAAPEGLAMDAAGNFYVADAANHRIRKISAAGVVTTLAGSTAGYKDATGAAAQFNEPQGVAVDHGGNVYVADTGNETIRKITPAGVVTTLAGLAGGIGSNDGAGSAARFTDPAGVAVDAAGNVYVADNGNGLIRKITPTGVVTTLAGRAYSFDIQDGTGAQALFLDPFALTFDGSGNLYVTDLGCVRKITPAGAVTTCPGDFNDDELSGIAVDAQGNLFVTDTTAHTINQVSTAGLITPIGGLPETSGSTSGWTGVALADNPGGLVLAANGTLYVADTGNDRLSKGLRITGAPVVANVATSVTDITTTSANLLANMNPAVAGTSVYVQYGTTTAYGKKITLSFPAQTGDAPVTVPVSAALTGLSPNTLYHVQFVATNVNGTNATQDFTFTTLPLLGSLQVHLADTYAVNAGAAWNVDGGDWQGSDAVLSVPIGTHKINFYVLTGFTTPASQTVTIAQNKAATATGTYGSILRVQEPVGVNLVSNVGTIDFGLVSIGSQATRTFTLTNTSTTLTLPNVYLQADGIGTSFTWDTSRPLPALAPGQSTTITVTFAPTFAGLANNSLHFLASNFTTTWGVDVLVKGTGNFSSTGAATGVTAAWATLNGTIPVAYQSYSTYFQYGASTSYGSATTTVTSTSGVPYSTVSYNLGGLKPGTIYHYRLVVSDGQGGTYYGADQTFTTPATSPPQWHWTEIGELGGAPQYRLYHRGVANTSATAYFYIGNDFNVWAFSKSGANWTKSAITTAANAADWLTCDSVTAQIFYMGLDSNVWNAYRTGTKWATRALTTTGDAAGNFVLNPVTHTLYYRNTSGGISYLTPSGTTFTVHQLPFTTANVGGGIAIDTTQNFIYYVGTDQQIWAYYPSGSTWAQMQLTTEPNANGTLLLDGQNALYYPSSSDNSPWCLSFTGATASQVALNSGITLSTGTVGVLYQHLNPAYIDTYGGLQIDHLNQATQPSEQLFPSDLIFMDGLDGAASTLFGLTLDGRFVQLQYQ